MAIMVNEDPSSFSKAPEGLDKGPTISISGYHSHGRLNKLLVRARELNLFSGLTAGVCEQVE